MDKDQGQGLKLGWVITEEFGEVVIDPSAYRVIMDLSTDGNVTIVTPPVLEDFEPFEAEEIEDFEPYCD